jgi:predicted nuclease of restriction endonuclease-like RecB superfamily
VRIRKGVVHPPYIDPQDADLLGLSDTLIGIFDRHSGHTRQELEEELKDFLGTGTAFLVHRGLSKLLYDRCVFEAPAGADPALLREQVFTAAAAAYRAGTSVRFDRETVLRTVAEGAGLTPLDVDRQLYADLKDAEVLVAFKRCAASWLLHRYNVALAQAVLLRATGLDLEIEGETAVRYREVFRKLKFFQLLHDVRVAGPGRYHIHIDGPVSLFRSSQRYGLQMAQFLPTILHCAAWTLTAAVVWGVERREAVFRLSPAAGLQPVGHIAGQWVPEEVGWLETQFRKLDTAWDISPDAEIIHLGGQGILAPDYVFTHRPTGMTVHMEILGFWRRGSVQSRLDLLRQHGPANLILALSKDLGVDEEEAAGLPGEVYVFRTTPIAREVYTLLETMRERPGGFENH